MSLDIVGSMVQVELVEKVLQFARDSGAGVEVEFGSNVVFRSVRAFADAGSYVRESYVNLGRRGIESLSEVGSCVVDVREGKSGLAVDVGKENCKQIKVDLRSASAKGRGASLAGGVDGFVEGVGEHVGVESCDGVVGGFAVGVDSASERVGVVGCKSRVGLKRPGKKQRDRLARKEARSEFVPEWRRKGGVTVEKTDARKTLEAKWVAQNNVDILKLEEQKKRLEARACCDFPTFKVKSPEALVLEEEERLKKLRQNIAKYEADTVYWNKRKQVGAVEKAIALEMEIMDGQLSGKYDVFADKRTIGWAKTVKTNSSTGSSAKKTVWSGSGASKLSDNSESVVSLEKYEALEKKHSEVVGKLSNRDVDMERLKGLCKKLNKENKELRGESLYSAYD